GCCRLLCKPSALAQHLVRSLGRSAVLWGGQWLWPRWPRLQMLRQLLKPPEPEPAVARELLQMPDSGLVALDWLVGPWGAAGGGGGGPSPVLLLIPNAAGQVTGGLLQLGLRALERGFVPVLLRGQLGHHTLPGPAGAAAASRGPLGDRGVTRHSSTGWVGKAPSIPHRPLGAEEGLEATPSPCVCVSRARAQLSAPRAGVPMAPSPRWPPRPHRYAGSLAEAVDVDRLLGSRSLRELEEALFCRTKSRPTSWEAYWECNEPLRDADEAAVPVLCLCGADDPVRGPPARSLPLELFRSSPYFFLLLTPRGGHCGFPRRGPGRCWGHEAVLEFFRAMAEFLQAEERRKGLPWPR
ncbi:ABH15 protein, partial [Dromas ardeola]|nr:ABH15 protein [Dromas ardeola]